MMKPSMRHIACLVLCLPFPVGTAYGQALPQQDIVAKLRSDKAEERLAAVQAALALAPRERSEALVEAVASETRALQQELARKRAARNRGESIPAANHDLVDHYPSLLKVLIDAERPSDLPLLVSAIGTGNMVMNAIAARGDTAWPALQRLIRSGDDQQAVGALGTVARMFTKGKITGRSAEEAIAAVAGRLSGTQAPIVVASAARVAVAAKDQAMLQKLRLLRSFGPGALQLTLRPADNGGWLNRELDLVLQGK